MWADKEKEYLKKNWNKFNNKELGKQLGRCESSVFKMGNTLKLIRTTKTDQWTLEQTEYLIANYNLLSKGEISLELNKAPSTVNRKIKLLGLKKEKKIKKPSKKSELIKVIDGHKIYKKRSYNAISGADSRTHADMLKCIVKMKKFQDEFNLKEEQKFIVDKQEIVGRVIGESKYFVTLKTKNYVESFSKSSIFVGETIKG